MSEETRSPIIATRSAPPSSRASASSNRWRSGLPPISAVRAGGGLDRGQDRAGPRPLAARHRHRRVVAGRDQRRAARRAPASRSAAPRSRSRGGRRRRRPRPPRAGLADQQLAPAAATISFSGSAPITKAPPPFAASPASRAVTMPAVTIRSGADLDPHLAQPLRVGLGRLAGVVGDEDAAPRRPPAAPPAPPPSRAPARGRSRRPRRDRPEVHRIRPRAARAARLLRSISIRCRQ